MRSIFFSYFSGYSYFENKVNEGLFKTVKGGGEGMERGWRGGGEGVERGWRGGRRGDGEGVERGEERGWRGGHVTEQIMLVQVFHVQLFVRIYNEENSRVLNF